MSDNPQPISKGKLTSAPFAHLLLSIHGKALDGTLAIWPEDERSGQDRVLFQKGQPVAARFLDPAPNLERGLLTLFQRESGAFAFYKEDLVGKRDDVIRGRVNTYQMVTKAVRTRSRQDAIPHILRRLGDTPQRLQSADNLDEFDFDNDEKQFLELLRAEPATVAELVERSGEPEVARRMIYLLTITKKLVAYDPRPTQNDASKRLSSVAAPMKGMAPSFSPASASSLPPGTMSSAPPRSSFSPGEIVAPKERPPEPAANLSEEHRAMWLEVTNLVSMMDRQNYFQMLGVKESASPEEIRAGYLRFAKLWHPDRIPAELEPMRKWVDEIFHLATQAKDTLLDNKSKQEYVKNLVQGGGTPEAERQLTAVLDAAFAFQKVDVLVRRQKWDEALEIIDKNLSIAPKEADYLASKAWILLQQHGVEDEAQVQKIKGYIKAALSSNSSHVQAHFTRGTLLKRLGQHDKALQHFRRVAELNPKHLEAVREVRIARMRLERGRSSAPPQSYRPSGGFLGKIFGGKKK